MASVAIFVENRFSSGEDRKIRTDDRRMANMQWHKLGPNASDIRLCARVTPVALPGANHLVEGNVLALPYYHGLLEAVQKLPLLTLRSLAIVKNADLVVIKSPGIIGTVAALAARVTRTPYVIHLVGDAEDVIGEENRSLVRSIVKIIARKITQRIVYHSKGTRYSTREFLQKKYPAKKREQEFWYTDAVILPADEIASSSFVPGRIVAIGSQERKYKGHDLLIKALPAIREQVPTAHLVLVGKGACRRQLEELTERLNVEHCVDFVDYLSGWTEVSEMVQSAHVFAMPSRTEGLPRALLEAMSLGVACVGSDVAGIPELLPSSLITPKNQVSPLSQLLISIMNDLDRRNEAANECLERSRSYSADALNPYFHSWQTHLQDLISAK